MAGEFWRYDKPTYFSDNQLKLLHNSLPSLPVLVTTLPQLVHTFQSLCPISTLTHTHLSPAAHTSSQLQHFSPPASHTSFTPLLALTYLINHPYPLSTLHLSLPMPYYFSNMWNYVQFGCKYICILRCVSVCRDLNKAIWKQSMIVI